VTTAELVELDIDPVAFDVFWTRLTTMLDEQATAIQRSAFSPLVREAGDCSAGVFTVDGAMIAQAVTGTPGHVFALPACVKFMLRKIPIERWGPRDVIISNDPYENCGHQYDLTIATPIYDEDQLIGIYASTAHVLDIGGRISDVGAKEVYEEGLILPPLHLQRDGVRDHAIETILIANVRTPHEVMGDIAALVGVNEVGRQQIVDYMHELGVTSLAGAGAEMMRRAERALRVAIAKVPDGTYTGEVHADGFPDEQVVIRVTINVSGDALEVDFEGSSPASKYAVNVVYNYTRAYTVYALKCALAPDIPNNEGSLAPIKVHAPLGGLLHAQSPSPVGARHIIGHLIPGAVYAALGKAVPSLVPAEGSGAVWSLKFSGRRPDGQSFMTSFLLAGGMGARSTKDGLSCTAFPTGTRAVPIEVLEGGAPIVFHRKGLREGSAGDGQFRGGLGQVVEIGVLPGNTARFSLISEHIKFPTAGMMGGEAGAAGEAWVAGAPIAKGSTTLAGDDVITMLLPGGGGYGPPSARAQSARRADEEAELLATPFDRRSDS
jgi:N-methylhydantoinase B